MQSISQPTVSALRRTPEQVAWDVARIAADGDKRARNALLRDALSRIRVDQLAAAALATEAGTVRGDRG